MKALNERQMDIGTAIREIAPPPDNDSWGDYVDMTRALAAIIDANNVLTHPQRLQKSFQAAWAASAKLWMAESERILRGCVGGKEDFDRIQSHPNGRKAFDRILARVKETHGELKVGVAVEVEVDDILFDLEILG